ncbi:MAG: hypothetical protein ACE5HB_08440, partial [Terriglobia bacterium]
ALLSAVVFAAFPVRGQERRVAPPAPQPCYVCGSYKLQVKASEARGAEPRGVFVWGAPRPSDTFIDLGALQRLHDHFQRWHNQRIHTFAERAFTSLYSRELTLFGDRFQTTKGIDFFQLAGGRFSLGFETQRTIVSESDRGSHPLRDASVCHAVSYQGGPCGSVPFRAGERRYGLSFRWNLKRD